MFIGPPTPSPPRPPQLSLGSTAGGSRDSEVRRLAPYPHPPASPAPPDQGRCRRGWRGGGGGRPAASGGAQPASGLPTLVACTSTGGGALPCPPPRYGILLSVSCILLGRARGGQGATGPGLPPPPPASRQGCTQARGGGLCGAWHSKKKEHSGRPTARQGRCAQGLGNCNGGGVGGSGAPPAPVAATPPAGGGFHQGDERSRECGHLGRGDPSGEAAAYKKIANDEQGGARVWTVRSAGGGGKRRFVAGGGVIYTAGTPPPLASRPLSCSAPSPSAPRQAPYFPPHARATSTTPPPASARAPLPHRPSP